MADGDGIGSKIIGALGDVGEGVGEELKKFGKSATSQVTGKPVSDSSGKPSKKDSSQGVSETPQAKKPENAQNSFFGELKKIGETATGQISGNEEAAVSSKQLSEMQKKDKEFSSAESEAIKQKIQRMYQDYAAKKAQEERQEQAAEAQEEQAKQQQAQVVEQKKKQDLPNRAIEQTKAEIKNYGSE